MLVLLPIVTFLFASVAAKCDDFCKTCEADQCKECALFHYLDVDRSCQSCRSQCARCTGPLDCSDCAYGFFVRPDFNCEPCGVSNCTFCSNKTDCRQCDLGFVLNSTESPRCVAITRLDIGQTVEKARNLAIVVIMVPLVVVLLVGVLVIIVRCRMKNAEEKIKMQLPSGIENELPLSANTSRLDDDQEHKKKRTIDYYLDDDEQVQKTTEATTGRPIIQ